MASRRFVLSACCLALLLAAISPISAGSVANKTMRVTFSQPVRLPGVGLAPGTYIFEVPDPERAWEVVQVLSRDRSQVYFMGFTRIVNRPHSLPRDQVVSIGETQTGVPAPIDIWYPDGQSTGHQFIYSDRR